MNKTILAALLILLVSNCVTNDDTRDPIDCSPVACTQIFISIDVTIRNSTGTPVALDHFEVLDSTTSEDLSRELTDEELRDLKDRGTYPLYDDRFVAGNQNTSRNIVFRGFIDNEEVVSAEYTVGADCCHVGLVSGNLDIVID